MAITIEGAKKIAAKKLGITFNRYIGFEKQGLKYCCGCKKWHSKKRFHKDRSRTDGLTAQCIDWRSSTSRRLYQKRPQPLPGRRYAPARDGDKKQAQGRVNHLIAVGILPSPKVLPCNKCGHIYKKNGMRHDYHHYQGYRAEHHETVEVLCRSCHTKEDRNGKNKD